jgi:DNA-binding MarR family transcriptional regulator
MPTTRTPAQLLRAVARLHVRAQRATLAFADASATQCTILTELGRAPSMTLAELSRRLRLDKGWTSRAIEQLVQDGLVAKVGSDVDRRVVALSLTRAGAAEHRRIEGMLDGQVARVMARVPDAERDAVARALTLLHDAYLAELAGEAPNESTNATEVTCLTTR